jgi:hypothetical protein
MFTNKEGLIFGFLSFRVKKQFLIILSKVQTFILVYILGKPKQGWWQIWQ